MEKIAVICDMHLSEKKSIQYAFLQRAVEHMRQDDIRTVICLGDMTSFGQLGAWELYKESMRDFEHYDIMGNAEVRDLATRECLQEILGTVKFKIGGRSVYGLNTSDREITLEDRERLCNIKDGDIILMHHAPQKLVDNSRDWITELMEHTAITVLHGHEHCASECFSGKSRVIGFRALDPDKALGGFPSISYLEISDISIDQRECVFDITSNVMDDLSNYFGLSCVDNHKDVRFAIENSVKYIELRCNAKDWQPDMELFPLLDEWRSKTAGYLSMHFPNLQWENGTLRGKKQWIEAIEYALLINADSLTIHPPRINNSEMYKGGEAWNELLNLYVDAVNHMPRNVKIGIENIHVSKKDTCDEYRPFGVIPEDVLAWIDAINEAVECKERVGTVLDVGHARNNKSFAQKYPIGRWYDIMGNKTVAYHIHQVIRMEKGLKNHRPIENWFGPMINYTSFFWCWEHGLINHVPVFLEVKGSENFGKSIMAFQSTFFSNE